MVENIFEVLRVKRFPCDMEKKKQPPAIFKTLVSAKHRNQVRFLKNNNCVCLVLSQQGDFIKMMLPEHLDPILQARTNMKYLSKGNCFGKLFKNTIFTKLP